ncbi:MAG: hypothetical protein PHC45_07430 [Clostridiaceae bacterium]|nr:hypothetical protein [Clostridiaceae bacterium]
MEYNIDQYIRRLIELDSTAVMLKGERDAELSDLEMHIKNEIRDLEAVLEEAAITAKGKHDEIIEAAQIQVKAMDEAVRLRIDELQAYFLNIKEDAATDIWKQLLAVER